MDFGAAADIVELELMFGARELPDAAEVLVTVEGEGHSALEAVSNVRRQEKFGKFRPVSMQFVQVIGELISVVIEGVEDVLSRREAVGLIVIDVFDESGQAMSVAVSDLREDVNHRA